jgi:ElaB/YqjD/DUF883 family membrane-anchored ribosome-binding protein
MSDYTTNERDAFIGELGDEFPAREGERSFKAAKASAKAAAASLKEVAGSVLGEARERIRDLTGEAAGEAQHRYRDLEAWVQLRPARAIGVAAAVGVLLGLLMRGRTTRVVYVRDR